MKRIYFLGNTNISRWQKTPSGLKLANSWYHGNSCGRHCLQLCLWSPPFGRWRQEGRRRCVCVCNSGQRVVCGCVTLKTRRSKYDSLCLVWKVWGCVLEVCLQWNECRFVIYFYLFIYLFCNLTWISLLKKQARIEIQFQARQGLWGSWIPHPARESILAECVGNQSWCQIPPVTYLLSNNL